MPYRVVRQGDHVARIARLFGVTQESIWDDPHNERLRRMRGDGSVLSPGDIIFVPEPAAEVELRVASGETKRFIAELPEVELVVILATMTGPIANTPCSVRGSIGDAVRMTNAEGRLSFRVPADTEEVLVLSDGLGIEFRFRVGSLDPVSTRTGAAARLVALGFLPHRHGDQPCSQGELRGALSSFQRQHGLSESGELDAATQRRLVEAYGC